MPSVVTTHGLPGVMLPKDSNQIIALATNTTEFVHVFDPYGKYITEIGPGETIKLERKRPPWWKFWLHPRWVRS